MATTLEEMARAESLPMAEEFNEGTVQDIKVDTHGHLTAMVRIRMMCKQLFRTLQFVGDTFFHSRPMAEEPAESSTGPCCNTADCTAPEQGDVMGPKVRQAQADRLQHSAVELKQAFQTVRLPSLCCCPPAACFPAGCQAASYSMVAVADAQWKDVFCYCHNLCKP